MITGRPTDGQRTPLQVFETLYIGDAVPWPSFAGPCIGLDGAKSKFVSEGSNTTTTARIVPGGRVYREQHEVMQ